MLGRLVQHPRFPTFEITAIVRQPEKAKKLEKFGVKVAVGSYKTDLPIVEKLAQESHVVINCVHDILALLLRVGLDSNNLSDRRMRTTFQLFRLFCADHALDMRSQAICLCSSTQYVLTTISSLLRH